MDPSGPPLAPEDPHRVRDLGLGSLSLQRPESRVKGLSYPGVGPGVSGMGGVQNSDRRSLPRVGGEYFVTVGRHEEVRPDSE